MGWATSPSPSPLSYPLCFLSLAPSPYHTRPDQTTTGQTYPDGNSPNTHPRTPNRLKGGDGGRRHRSAPPSLLVAPYCLTPCFSLAFSSIMRSLVVPRMLLQDQLVYYKHGRNASTRESTPQVVEAAALSIRALEACAKFWALAFASCVTEQRMRLCFC